VIIRAIKLLMSLRRALTGERNDFPNLTESRHMTRSYHFTHTVMIIFIVMGAAAAVYGFARVVTAPPAQIGEMMSGLILIGSGLSVLTCGLIGRVLLHIAQSAANCEEYLAKMAHTALRTKA